ncbi:MAG: hypothetical protein ACTHME_03745 [Candidatus Nitrosocosmicus sp.]
MQKLSSTLAKILESFSSQNISTDMRLSVQASITDTVIVNS